MAGTCYHDTRFLQKSLNVSFIHHVQEIGLVLIPILISGLIVIDNDVEYLTVAGLDGNELLVGILVKE